MKNPNKTRRYKIISGEKMRRVFGENLLVGFEGGGMSEKKYLEMTILLDYLNVVLNTFKCDLNSIKFFFQI